MAVYHNQKHLITKGKNLNNFYKSQTYYGVYLRTKRAQALKLS